MPPDNPFTTNDESNDQPTGYFGTLTLSVFSFQSGNYYTLDGDVDGNDLHRLYFPKGGWIDFAGCELDADLQGDCIDEEGRTWSIEGEESGALSYEVDEEGQDGLNADEVSDDDDEDER